MDRIVYTLASAGLVRSLGRAATWIFLPVVFVEIYGLSYATVGLLVASIVPVSMLAHLLGGSQSDRHGRRWLATIPSFVSALCMTAIFLFLNQGIALTMGLWAVNAFGMALSGPSQSAMIGDVTRSLDLPMAYSIQRVFVNAGFAISPALGGLIADTIGLRYLFLFGAVATLGEGLVLLLFLRETLPAGREISSERHWTQFTAPFRDRSFLLMLALLIGLVVVANQFGTPLTLYLVDVRQLPLLEFGYIYAINGALVVLMQIPISRWIERTRHYLVWMAGGTLLYGLGFILFGLGAAVPIFAVAMIVLTMGENSTSPIQQTVVSNFAGPKRRGSYFGAFNATANAARAVGPVLGTLLLALGATVWWSSIFGAALLVSILFLLLGRRLGSRVEHGVPEGPASAGG